jgi:hypothetical protein
MTKLFIIKTKNTKLVMDFLRKDNENYANDGSSEDEGSEDDTDNVKNCGDEHNDNISLGDCSFFRYHSEEENNTKIYNNLRTNQNHMSMNDNYEQSQNMNGSYNIHSQETEQINRNHSNSVHNHKTNNSSASIKTFDKGPNNIYLLETEKKNYSQSQNTKYDEKVYLKCYCGAYCKGEKYLKQHYIDFHGYPKKTQGRSTEYQMLQYNNRNRTAVELQYEYDSIQPATTKPKPSATTNSKQPATTKPKPSATTNSKPKRGQTTTNTITYDTVNEIRNAINKSPPSKIAKLEDTNNSNNTSSFTTVTTNKEIIRQFQINQAAHGSPTLINEYFANNQIMKYVANIYIIFLPIYTQRYHSLYLSVVYMYTKKMQRNIAVEDLLNSMENEFSNNNLTLPQFINNETLPILHNCMQQILKINIVVVTWISTYQQQGLATINHLSTYNDRQQNNFLNSSSILSNTSSSSTSLSNSFSVNSYGEEFSTTKIEIEILATYFSDDTFHFHPIISN